MLTPKQIRIFDKFLESPFKEFTYSEIKGDEKSNSIIQNALRQFLKDDLIIKREIANIILYKANLNNTNVFSYFDILIKEKLPNKVKNTIKIINQELSNVQFISIVIFGSYAQGKQKEKSGLDIAIFVNSTEDKKNCEMIMKSAELKSILQIDYHVFTKHEMLEMLNDKHENLGKQIAYKHMAIHNPLIFYSIISEGINNGFKIVK
jgi:predicted nucleotidyltransferase